MYTCLHTHTPMCTPAYTHTPLYVRLLTLTHPSVYACLHAHTPLCTPAYTHTHPSVYACLHTHAPLCTPAYTLCLQCSCTLIHNSHSAVIFLMLTRFDYTAFAPSLSTHTITQYSQSAVIFIRLQGLCFAR